MERGNLIRNLSSNPSMFGAVIDAHRMSEFTKFSWWMRPKRDTLLLIPAVTLVTLAKH